MSETGINLIESIKKYATKEKKKNGTNHSEELDKVAVNMGYNNWSLLHQHVIKANNKQITELRNILNKLKIQEISNEN